MPEHIATDAYEITLSAIPKTREHALALALAWGHTLTHWERIAGAAMSDPDAGGAVYATMHAAVHQADAAEVQRLCALAAVLPSEPGGLVDAEIDDDFALVPLLANLIDAPSNAGAGVFYVSRRLLAGWRAEGVEPVLTATMKTVTS